MDKRALLIDFNDSFTYNIASCLKELGIECLVIKYHVAKEYLHELCSSSGNSLVILGPGPGHPDEYSEFIPLIKESLNFTHVFHFGICLGHQLILKAQGAEVVRSQTPMHGRRESLVIPEWEGWFESKLWGKELKVQRYNSLAIKPSVFEGIDYWLNSQGEVTGSIGSNFVTYQFHPESVGTTGQKFLFSPLLKLNYNNEDGVSAKVKWTL